MSVSDGRGILFFSIKSCASPRRKNSEDVALLPAREASARYPQMVINFYEQKLTWHCSEEEQ